MLIEVLEAKYILPVEHKGKGSNTDVDDVKRILY